MANKRSSFRSVAVVPSTLEDAAQALRELEQAYRQAEDIEDRLNKEVERLHQQAQRKVTPLNEQMQSLLQGLRIFAEKNRKEHARGKTIRLSTGELFWRLSAAGLSVENEKQLIEAIQEKKLERFLRIKPPELDLNALKKEQSVALTLPGVTAQIPHERFYAKPRGVNVEFPLKKRKVKRPFAVVAA